MILADTSKWVDHLRNNEPSFGKLLDGAKILGHPLVRCEIAMGSLRDRAAVLHDLSDLPQISMSANDDVLKFVESRGLFSRGIGFIDAHLLLSVASTPGASRLMLLMTAKGWRVDDVSTVDIKSVRRLLAGAAGKER